MSNSSDIKRTERKYQLFFFLYHAKSNDSTSNKGSIFPLTLLEWIFHYQRTHEEGLQLDTTKESIKEVLHTHGNNTARDGHWDRFKRSQLANPNPVSQKCKCTCFKRSNVHNRPAGPAPKAIQLLFLTHTLYRPCQSPIMCRRAESLSSARGTGHYKLSCGLDEYNPDDWWDDLEQERYTLVRPEPVNQSSEIVMTNQRKMAGGGKMTYKTDIWTRRTPRRTRSSISKFSMQQLQQSMQLLGGRGVLQASSAHSTDHASWGEARKKAKRVRTTKAKAKNLYRNILRTVLPTFCAVSTVSWALNHSEHPILPFFFLISTLVFICKVPDYTSLAGCVDFVLIFSFSNSTVTLFIQCFDQEVMWGCYIYF
jgi:hypothetical protein